MAYLGWHLPPGVDPAEIPGESNTDIALWNLVEEAEAQISLEEAREALKVPESVKTWDALWDSLCLSDIEDVESVSSALGVW